MIIVLFVISFTKLDINFYCANIQLGKSAVVGRFFYPTIYFKIPA